MNICPCLSSIKADVCIRTLWRSACRRWGAHCYLLIFALLPKTVVAQATNSLHPAPPINTHKHNILRNVFTLPAGRPHATYCQVLAAAQVRGAGPGCSSARAGPHGFPGAVRSTAVSVTTDLPRCVVCGLFGNTLYSDRRPAFPVMGGWMGG